MVHKLLSRKLKMEQIKSAEIPEVNTCARGKKIRLL
jgi:hypothetical protein